jgi:hypothetical protein
MGLAWSADVLPRITRTLHFISEDFVLCITSTMLHRHDIWHCEFDARQSQARKNAVMNRTSMRAFDTNVGHLLPPTQALSSSDMRCSSFSLTSLSVWFAGCSSVLPPHVLCTSVLAVSANLSNKVASLRRPVVHKIHIMKHMLPLVVSQQSIATHRVQIDK